MFVFVLKKLLYGLSLMIGVVSLVFCLFAIDPADPARMLGGQFMDETTLLSIKEKYGLDKPAIERYFVYLQNLSPIKSGDNGLEFSGPDLGISYFSGKNVSQILAETIPNSLLLAGGAIGIALVLGIGMGIIGALNKDTAIDRFLIAFSALGMAGPSFFVGMLVSWLFGFKWANEITLPLLPILVIVSFLAGLFWIRKSEKRKFIYTGFVLFFLGSWWGTWTFELPGTGLPMTGSLIEIDPFLGKQLALKNLILPVITLGIRPLAVFMQLSRNSLLDVLQMDYIRTAIAKGLTKTRIIFVHALPGALNPVITAASGWFAGMLAGAVFIEFIFGWRGLGLELFEALQREDQPVVMGAVLFFAAFFVLVNILVDIMYAWLDPRIRLKNV